MVEEQSSKVVSCAVIYTDQKAGKNLPDNLTTGAEIEGFTKFYKVPIAVPILDN
ncbi:hypothetical protein [Psychrobacter sp. GP33]|uniref:hypothetical protein n=1 Tax=Psychrobacter sp. GP33 TaxID=2758709 RepID=UPI0015FCDC3E|nr:hypothetical protein [Psychrobacter sp. GP33]